MATNEHDERDGQDGRNGHDGRDLNGEQQADVTQPAPGEEYVVDYDAVPAEEDRTVRESEMYDPAVDGNAATGHDAAHTDHAGTPAAERTSDERVRDEDTRDHTFAPAAAGVAGTAGAASVAAARHDDSRGDRAEDADRAANTANTANTTNTTNTAAAAHTDGDLTDRERAAIRDERGTTTATPTATTTETAHTVNDEERRSIQVQAPTTPVKRSNRGFGIGVMLLSSLVFAAIYGAIIYLVTFYFLDPSVDDGTQGVLQALGTPVFWVPVVVYLVACILWVLIVNRAGGWLHVLFGLIVGVLAYASVVAVLSVTASLAESRPEDFADFVFRSLIDSRALLAFIVARELPIWFGAWIGRRGRKLREQHAEARRVYDDEVASQSDRSQVG